MLSTSIITSTAGYPKIATFSPNYPITSSMTLQKCIENHALEEEPALDRTWTILLLNRGRDWLKLESVEPHMPNAARITER